MPRTEREVMTKAEFAERVKLNGWRQDAAGRVLIPVPGGKPLRVPLVLDRSDFPTGFNYRATLAACWRASDAAGLPKWK